MYGTRYEPGFSLCCIILQVYIRIRDDEWNIYRRYAQFYSLHKELKKHDAIVSTFDFPPKKTLGNKVRNSVKIWNYLPLHLIMEEYH
jgi:hypothetical protein